MGYGYLSHALVQVPGPDASSGLLFFCHVVRAGGYTNKGKVRSVQMRLIIEAVSIVVFIVVGVGVLYYLHRRELL
ncbi:MAG: hypothetical protein D9V47_08035 [Clostridia bacterium]|nr:MAG: hypothetical protein D9V47_08035 [Clostridia bacterium]